MVSIFRAKTVIAILFLTLTGSGVVLAGAHHPMMTRHEAARLAREALNYNAILEPVPAFDGDFFFFGEMNPNPQAAAIVRNVAVNRRTGDVWDTLGFCTLLTSPSALKSQEVIRARSGISEKEYRRLRAMKPSCDADVDPEIDAPTGSH